MLLDFGGSFSADKESLEAETDFHTFNPVNSITKHRVARDVVIINLCQVVAVAIGY